MKKILLVIFVSLVALTACGPSYNKIAKEAEAHLKESLKDEGDFKIFNFEVENKKEISGKNKILELNDVDFEIKNSQDIVAGGEDVTHVYNIIEFEGKLDEFLEYKGINSGHCVIDDVIIIDSSTPTDLESLCKKLDGKYKD